MRELFDVNPCQIGDPAVHVVVSPLDAGSLSWVAGAHRYLLDFAPLHPPPTYGSHVSVT